MKKYNYKKQKEGGTKMIYTKNPSEEDYREFFNRYFDLSDKMTEFSEKWEAKYVDTAGKNSMK